jgi:hypothetical protein
MKTLRFKYGMNCKTQYSTGFLISTTVNTTVYLACPGFEIQFSILHERGDYLWIGPDDQPLADGRVFGDVPRALNK